ncbi:MAG: flagellar basal body protein FliL [Campylobacteraceae bacterium 4484_4]|nr:MAG: flagellar basal body protein FliL [Campylobacteraceae bacterium 4484_4]
MAEAAQQQTEEVVAKKGGSNILLIILTVLLFLLLIGGGVAGYLLLSADDEVLDDASKATQTEAAAPAAKQTSVPGKSQRATDYTKIGPMYPLDQFIVNLYAEGGDRYLKATINLEMDKEEMGAELDKKNPLIRDIVIKTLSAKTYEEISTIKGKEQLKDEIVTKINQVLTDGQIKNIFFTDFVIQ